MSERTKNGIAFLALVALGCLGGYAVYMQPEPAPAELTPLTDAEFAALKEQLRADLRASVAQAAPKSSACTCGAPSCPCAGPLEPPGDDPQPTPAPGLHVNIVSEKDSYAPGETVELRAEGTAKGWAWWSLAKHRVYEDAKVCVFSTATPGDYVFVLAGSSDAYPVPLLAARTIHIEGTPPAPTPPGPGPKPPEPAPPQPTPGLIRVLIIEETSERTPAIANVLHSQKLLAYLNSHCSKTGNTPDWRILDQDTDVSKLGQRWVDAMRAPRSSLPWIVICNGTQCQGAPLPKTVDETLALLAKWGGS